MLYICSVAVQSKKNIRSRSPGEFFEILCGVSPRYFRAINTRTLQEYKEYEWISRPIRSVLLKRRYDMSFCSSSLQPLAGADIFLAAKRLKLGKGPVLYVVPLTSTTGWSSYLYGNSFFYIYVFLRKQLCLLAGAVYSLWQSDSSLVKVRCFSLRRWHQRPARAATYTATRFSMNTLREYHKQTM